MTGRVPKAGERQTERYGPGYADAVFIVCPGGNIVKSSSCTAEKDRVE